jgi:hypothetical protein
MVCQCVVDVMCHAFSQFANECDIAIANVLMTACGFGRPLRMGGLVLSRHLRHPINGPGVRNSRRVTSDSVFF